MNIFYLSRNPKECAEMHNDKHVVKMILESAQLLSTAHRILDGVQVDGVSASGRKKTVWKLSDYRDTNLYSATHINHPSAVWVRLDARNYIWLHNLLQELCSEYTYRYGKVHKCQETGLVAMLGIVPKRLMMTFRTDIPCQDPPCAMPDDCKVPGDAIQSYRNYYNKYKTHLATWNGKVNSRTTPTWYNGVTS